MALGNYIPKATLVVKVAICLAIIAIALKAAPIPDTYKAYFRV